MSNSQSDDWSSKDSQDGSQMLDSVKIQDLVDRHTAFVSLVFHCKPVDKLNDHCHRSRLAVAASRPAFVKHKTMALRHYIVGPRLRTEPTRRTCRFTHCHNILFQMLTDFNRKIAQRPHLEELKELLEAKKHIQREIDKTEDELERASMAVSQQLIACIKSRMDALRR